MSSVHHVQARPVLGRGGWLALALAGELLVYCGAVALHVGLRLALGGLVLAAPHVMTAAAIAETILGLVVAANLVLVLRGGRRTRAITLGAQAFVLLGDLFGMSVLLSGGEALLSLNLILHYLMIASVVVVVALTLLGPKEKA
jgi:hypothetical protein